MSETTLQRYIRESYIRAMVRDGYTFPEAVKSWKEHADA